MKEDWNIVIERQYCPYHKKATSDVHPGQRCAAVCRLPECPLQYLERKSATDLVDEIVDEEMKFSAQYYELIERLEGKEQPKRYDDIDDYQLMKILDELMVHIMGTPADENFRPGAMEILRKLINMVTEEKR